MAPERFGTIIIGGAPEIWNFPGFPEGISGVELVERMFKQAERFGAELVFPEEVVDLNLKGKVKTVTTRRGQRSGLGIIIATGTHRKKLAVPGETELLGGGVSYCAVCDGPLFKGRTTAVVGFGNEAFEDALYLSELSEKVILVAHSSEIEAEKALVDQCAEKDNIEMLKARAKAILGDEFVTSIAVSDLENGEEKRIPVEGIFLSLGGVPMTNLVKKTGIEVDKRGCIKVDRRQATNVEGVYAAQPYKRTDMLRESKKEPPQKIANDFGLSKTLFGWNPEKNICRSISSFFTCS